MLISFEGIDGCGKSTQIALLREYLHEEGRDTSVYREPGGTVLSEKVRSLLLDTDVEIDAFAELLLFSAARAQLVKEAVNPSLGRGEVVILDRFYDSTTAYQGAGRGVVTVEWAEDFHAKVTGGLAPDLTFLLDLDPVEAGKRISGRDKDRMESSESDFYDKVRKAYLDLAARHERFVIINAEQEIDEIQEQICTIVSERLSR